jgi:alpha-glucosidase (family GH31 glycosyl hydrolase)
LFAPAQTDKLAFASKAVLDRRYELLPYYYTLFNDAHNGVSPYVLHALIFDWPADEKVRLLYLGTK